MLGREGYTTTMVDVRGMSSILHLKSGISYIGGRTLVVMEEMAGLPCFQGYDLLRVGADESYAAKLCARQRPGTGASRLSTFADGARRQRIRSPAAGKCPSFKRWMAV